MQRLISLMVGVVFFASMLQASPSSERFVGDVSGVASIEGVPALWQNPAGIAFFGGTESALGYFYEWNKQGDRQHAGLSLALNMLDLISLGGGFNGRFVGKNAIDRGSDITGIFGFSLRFTDSFALGLSFMKSYYFREDRAKDVKIGFGFQARPFKFLALGGLIKEVHEGYFKTPEFRFGVALRPINDDITLGVDIRLTPYSPVWNDGFRVDPLFNAKAYFGGFGIGGAVEIPGIKNGWHTPNFFVNLEFNFAYMGFSVSSHLHPRSLYTVGGHVRTSSEEWRSIDRPSGLWVELTLDQEGNLLKKPDMLSSLFEGEQNPLGVLTLLRRLGEDDAIAGVTMTFMGFEIGDAHAQEWRDALVALRLREKQVVVFLENPSERDYFIASAASKVFMNQDATLTFRRFQATLTYFHDLLEKVGVKATSIAAGNYKTAPRMWTNAKPSKEEIEVSSNIINSFYKSFLAGVSESRDISQEKLTSILDNGEITAASALEYGLIDGAFFKDEQAKALSGKEDATIPLWPNYHQRSFKTVSWAKPKKIIVIPIAGEIIDGRATPSLFSSFLGVKTGSLDVIETLEAALNDPDTSGIIIRINSPGGDAIAGSKIQHALSEAQKKVPVVASMSDVAASAGYMIASGAQHIIAEPNSITGSIGVFSLYFSGEALAKKLGVSAHEIASIKNPGPTLQRAMSKAETEQAKAIVEWYYDNFIKSVAKNLDLEEQYVRSQAEGRVWLGHEALARKLVHELGGFSEAIDAIKVLAELKETDSVALEIYDPHAGPRLSLFPRLMSYFNTSQQQHLDGMKWVLKPAITALSIENLHGKPQARLPFMLSWHKR